MKLVVFKEYNNFYILPFFRIYYNKNLRYRKVETLYVEIGWLKWCLGLAIK